MKVSVIVPNFNHSRFLRQRIDSILAQSYTDFELILLDDCSTDNSRDIINAYRDNPHTSHIVFNEQNTGSPFLQWEKGLALAQGEYVWIAESDDFAHPDFLQACVEQLDRLPEASLCHTGSTFIDAEGRPSDRSYDPWREDGRVCIYDSASYLRHNMTFADDCYNASMVVFRRQAYVGIDRTFASFRFAGDWLFMCHIILRGKVVVVHRKLNYYRWHGANTTSLSEKSSAWLYDKIRLYAEIFHIADIPAYNRWLVCGIIYKYIRRLRTGEADRNRLLTMAKAHLGVNRWHYALERVNKSLTNVLPCLPEGRHYPMR